MNTDTISSEIISNPEYLTELYSLVITAANLSKANNNLGKIFIPFNTDGQVRFSAKRGSTGDKDTENKIDYNADDITVIGGAATMIYEYINRGLQIEPIKRKTVDMDMVWWPRVSGPKTLTHAIISQSEIIKDFVEKVKENLEKKFKTLNGKKYLINDKEYTVKEVNITHKNAYGYGTNQLTIVLELESGESISIIDFSIYDSASAQTPGTTTQRQIEKNYLKNKSNKNYEKERSKWIVNMIRPMKEDPVYMTSIPIPKVKSSSNNAAMFSTEYSQNINKEIIINGQQINVPILERLKEQQKFILSNIKDTNKNSKIAVYEERLKFINSLISKSKKNNGAVIASKKPPLLSQLPVQSTSASIPLSLPVPQYVPIPQSAPIPSRYLPYNEFIDKQSGMRIKVTHNTYTNKLFYDYLGVNPSSGEYIFIHDPKIQIQLDESYRQYLKEREFYQQQQQIQLQQQQMYQKPPQQQQQQQQIAIKCNPSNIIEEVYVNPRNWEYYRQIVCNTTNGKEVYSYEIRRKDFLEARKKGMKTLESGKMLPSKSEYTYRYGQYGGNRTQKASKTKKQKTRKQLVGYANVLSLDGKEILYKVPINLI